MVKLIRHIEVTVTASETEALLLEANLIKEHRPRFNVVLRDDKSFPYILLHDHAFPRLAVYRGPRTGRGRYFGPYPDVGAVRASLQQLQKLFRLRNCRDSFFANRSRPCLQYQIGRCSAPCVGFITEEAYARDVEAAVMVLEGRDSEVTGALEQQMRTAAAGAAVRARRAVARSAGGAAQACRPSSRWMPAHCAMWMCSPSTASRATTRWRCCWCAVGAVWARRRISRVRPAAAEEVLASFLLQHYAREEPVAEIRVNLELPDVLALSEALTPPA